MVLLFTSIFSLGFIICTLGVVLPYYKLQNCNITEYNKVAEVSFLGYQKDKLLNNVKPNIKYHYKSETIIYYSFGSISNGLVEKEINIYFVFNNENKIIYQYHTHDFNP